MNSNSPNCISQRKRARCKRLTILTIGISLASTAICQTNIQAVIYLRDGTAIAGLVSWHLESKTYRVHSSTNSMVIPFSEVGRVVTPKPKPLDRANALIKEGKFREAINLLKPIVENYNMLEWDYTARKLLATCYLQFEKPEAAIHHIVRCLKSSPLRDQELRKLYLSAFAALREQAPKHELLARLSPDERAALDAFIKSPQAKPAKTP